MKYRVKHVVNKYPMSSFMFWITEYSVVNNWEVQCKKHWWSKWKMINSYDNMEDAYRCLLNYETDGKCFLPNVMKFQHNRIKGKYVNCILQMGKFNHINKNYNEGRHYYAGYKPAHYKYFYHCSYGKSYEEAICALWSDLEIKKIINK